MDGAFRLDKLDNHDVVDDVACQPEQHKVGPVHLVLHLDFGLSLFVRCVSLSSRRGGPITPRDIMQVAHGINLEHVGDHWHQQHERKEPKGVLLEVSQKVDWSEKEWQCVDRQHDDSSQGKPVEVVLAGGDVWLYFLCLWVGILHVVHCLERDLGHVVAKADDTGQDENGHDYGDEPEVWHGLFDGQ